MNEDCSRNESCTRTKYVYDRSGEEVGENNRSGWTVRVIPFAGRHLAHYQGSPNAAYFVHTDKLGSTTQATDYTGAVAQDEIYYPWGQEWNMAGTYQEERFARLGHRDTTETGLDPTKFRIYASSEGRWFSTDPVGGRAGSPQSLNRYAVWEVVVAAAAAWRCSLGMANTAARCCRHRHLRFHNLNASAEIAPPLVET